MSWFSWCHHNYLSAPIRDGLSLSSNRKYQTCLIIGLFEMGPSCFLSEQLVESNCVRLLNPTQPPRRRESFLAHISMTSEQGGRNSDTFLTGMHLAVITGDRFCAYFPHLKQAYLRLLIELPLLESSSERFQRIIRLKIIEMSSCLWSSMGLNRLRLENHLVCSQL